MGYFLDDKEFAEVGCGGENCVQGRRGDARGGQSQRLKGFPVPWGGQLGCNSFSSNIGGILKTKTLESWNGRERLGWSQG